MRLRCAHELTVATKKFGDEATNWKKIAQDATKEIDKLKQRNSELKTVIVQNEVDQNVGPRITVWRAEDLHSYIERGCMQ